MSNKLARLEVYEETPPPRCPERNLLCAVLVLSIREYLGVLHIGKESKEEVMRNARAWIFRRGEEPFSFEWCCNHLDMNPEVLRAALRKPSAARIRVLNRAFAANKKHERGATLMHA